MTAGTGRRHLSFFRFIWTLRKNEETRLDAFEMKGLTKSKQLSRYFNTGMTDAHAADSRGFVDSKENKRVGYT